MSVIPYMIFWGAVLTAVSSMTNDAQNTFDNCSTNYTVLENALLETSDNAHQLSTTFFNPVVSNLAYIKVKYHFRNSSESSIYIWSAASLYLIVKPDSLRYLSLFFSDFDKSSITFLTIQLPIECIGLKNVTKTEKDNLLLVLTHRLRLYAKYYHSMNCLVMPDGFEATVVSNQEKYKEFISKSGTVLFFTFPIILPIFVLIAFAIYAKGTSRKVLNKRDHHPSQAALVCVGQTFTIYVTIMDVIVMTKGELATYMFGIVCFVTVLEFVFVLSMLFILLLFCHGHLNHKCSLVDKVKPYFGLLTFFPPLFSLTTHTGFILEAWATSQSHGTAVMLFYSFCFVYFFVLYQKMYALIIYRHTTTAQTPSDDGSQTTATEQTDSSDTEGSASPSEDTECTGLRSCATQISGGYGTIQNPPSLTNSNHQIPGLNFCAVVLRMLIMGIIFHVIPVYIVLGFNLLPDFHGTISVVTDAYSFGQYSVVFAVFLLTYIVVYKTSNSIFSDDVIKVWKQLYTNGEAQDNEVELSTDIDEASALTAVLLYRLLKKNSGQDDKSERLLLQVVRCGSIQNESG